MNEEKTASYELMYIVPTSYTEDELGTIEQHVAGILAKHGASVVTGKRLGKFRFAYPIRHEQFGHYVLVEFTASTSAILPIEGDLRLDSKEVIRHSIVRMDELGANAYDLVQFQPVTVESHDRRRPRAPREEKPVDARKAKADQQAGVEALHTGPGAADAAAVGGLSAEDLEKKIEAAIGEKEA